MYEASEPGRREWSPIPDQFVVAELMSLTQKCWELNFRRIDNYRQQLELGRWVLTPTMTIRMSQGS